MQLQSALLLLTSFTASQAVQGEFALQPRVDPNRRPPESSYESKYPDDIRYTQLWYQGKCEVYIPPGGDGPQSGHAHTNDKYTLEPCQQYCLEQEDSTFSGCTLNHLNDRPEVAEACPTIYTAECLEGVEPFRYTNDEDQPHPYLYGLCTCEGEEFALAVVDIVVQGLQELGKVLCTVVNGVIDVLVTIAEAAVSAIPGGQFVGNAARIVKAAKTFSENALDAAEFFNGYLSGDLCTGSLGEFTLPDNPEDAFNSLVKAPDTLNGESMTSIGCKRKGGCKKPEKRPDLDVPVRSDGDKGPEKPTQKTTEKTTAEPTTEKTTADPTAGKPTAEPTTEKTTADSTTDKPTETTQPTTTTKPTSTTTSTKKEKATDCAVCGQGSVKRAAQEERWGVMFGRAGPQCVKDDFNEPDANDDQARCGPDGLLSGRATNAKTETVKLTTKFEVNFGSYATCGTAKNEAEIDKWYLLKDGNCGTTEIIKRKDGDPALQGVEFDTEHVYEPQTVPDFYEWLADGNNVGTHIKPSKDWVEKVLVNPNSPDLFKLVSPGRAAGKLGTDPNGNSLQEVISFGFGRSDGTKGDSRREKAVAHKDFCLLETSVNKKKGVWFNNNFRPNRLTGKHKTFEMVDVQHDIRLVSTEAPYPVINVKLRKEQAAAPFRYLETNVPNEDPIWNKWMRVSNWIDLVLHEFDNQYPWGDASNIKGEPERTGPRPRNRPSLRALYANFIDERLKAIEAKAATWSADAQKNYNANKKWNQDAKHQQYMADAWNPQTGFVSSNKLRFPRPANLPDGISEFGAWGYDDMTFDAGGNRLATPIGPLPLL